LTSVECFEIGYRLKYILAICGYAREFSGIEDVCQANFPGRLAQNIKKEFFRALECARDEEKK